MLSNEQSTIVKGTWRDSEVKKLRDNIIDFSREVQAHIHRLMQIMKLIRMLMLNLSVNRNKMNNDTKHIKITKDSKREISIKGTWYLRDFGRIWKMHLNYGSYQESCFFWCYDGLFKHQLNKKIQIILLMMISRVEWLVVGLNSDQKMSKECH